MSPTPNSEQAIDADTARSMFFEATVDDWNEAQPRYDTIDSIYRTSGDVWMAN